MDRSLDGGLEDKRVECSGCDALVDIYIYIYTIGKFSLDGDFVFLVLGSACAISARTRICVCEL